MKNEPVDILDKDGKKTGQVLMKQEAHDNGFLHGGAHLWIYNKKGEVLVQRRAPNKVVWPNIWDVAVAGHIAAGKTAEGTILDEADEELGLKIDPAKITYLQRIRLSDKMPGGWTHNVFVWIYITELDINIKDMKLEEAETSAVRWVGSDELEKELNNPGMDKEFRDGLSKETFHMAIAEVRRRLKNAK